MKTRRQRIENVIDDLAAKFLYYDRKEDSSLSCGAIEEAVQKGEISVEEMVARFAKHLELLKDG